MERSGAGIGEGSASIISHGTMEDHDFAERCFFEHRQTDGPDYLSPISAKEDAHTQTEIREEQPFGIMQRV